MATKTASPARGSQRHLLRNARSAILAAIEIYNKPTITYRDEMVVVLLINAWELALKALLLQNGCSVFYRTRQGESPRSLSLTDALEKAQAYLPRELNRLALTRNLQMMITYRDSVIHFYASNDLRAVMYGLAQASILNFRDLLSLSFGENMSSGVTWVLLPLGLDLPANTVRSIGGEPRKRQRRRAVEDFLGLLEEARVDVAEAGERADRVITSVRVHLESVKNVSDADLVVGVVTEASGAERVIERRIDPNTTHPMRQKEVVAAIGTLFGRAFTSYIFQAILWKYDLKQQAQYCWAAREGVLVRYSREIVQFIRQLSGQEVDTAVADYRHHLRDVSQKI